MSDQPLTEQHQPESIIVVRFAGQNSTILEIKYQNISPLQALCASWVLERDARNTLDEMTETRKRNTPPPRLVVPEGYEGIVPK